MHDHRTDHPRLLRPPRLRPRRRPGLLPGEVQGRARSPDRRGRGPPCPAPTAAPAATPAATATPRPSRRGEPRPNKCTRRRRRRPPRPSPRSWASTPTAEDVVAVLRCQGTKDKAARRASTSASRPAAPPSSPPAASRSAPGAAWASATAWRSASSTPSPWARTACPTWTTTSAPAAACAPPSARRSSSPRAPRHRKGSVVLCSNRNAGQGQRHQDLQGRLHQVRGLREEPAPRSASRMVNGIPVTDYAKCTSCGVCVEKCPTKCYVLLEGRVDPSGHCASRKCESPPPASLRWRNGPFSRGRSEGMRVPILHSLVTYSELGTDAAIGWAPVPARPRRGQPHRV